MSVAAAGFPGTVFRAELRLNTGATIWRLNGVGSSVDGLMRAQALTELKTYAAKQARPVGRG